MIIFYRMDLIKCDSKSELCMKTEKVGRSKTWKKFQVQNCVSEGLFKTKMTFRIFWSLLQSSPLDFHIQNIIFNKVCQKSRKHMKNNKIPNSYPLLGGLWYKVGNVQSKLRLSSWVLHPTQMQRPPQMQQLLLQRLLRQCQRLMQQLLLSLASYNRSPKGHRGAGF